jgi:hypothetical protein
LDKRTHLATVEFRWPSRAVSRSFTPLRGADSNRREIFSWMNLRGWRSHCTYPGATRTAQSVRDRMTDKYPW